MDQFSTDPEQNKNVNDALAATGQLPWDHDDFEPPAIDFQTNVHGAEPPEEDGIAGRVVWLATTNDATMNAPTSARAEEEDEWLAPIKAESKGQPGTQQATDEVSAKRVYLTKQFKSLSTPVSMKKSRCVICTRPVPEGTKSKYCSMHALNNEEE